VEQVRQALALDASNFLLLSHSWVGILAIEHKQQHQQPLEGLIISDMVWGMPGANRYAESVTST
jgi:proline iminopeptidase